MEYRFDENILYFMRIYEYTKEEKIKINISLLKKKFWSTRSYKLHFSYL